MDQKPDVYEPDNLLPTMWHCPLWISWRPKAFMASGDKAAMYALIAEKFGIEKSSIFAV